MEAKSTNTLTPPEILRRQESLLQTIARAASSPGKAWSKYETRIQCFLEDETFNLDYHISGVSPLSKAATYQKDIILMLLLKSGKIDVDLRNDEGRTALSYAAEFQRASCVETLLHHGANHECRDNSGRCPLSWASTPSGSPGDYKTVADLLVARGADINSEDEDKFTPLTLATIKDLEEVVSDLLSFDGVDVNHLDVQGRSPLSHAAELRRPEITRLLITDKKKLTPLAWATISGHWDIVRDLLSTDTINVDPRDLNQRTPLSYAAESGYDNIVQLLVESSADIDSQDTNGRTPLVLATIEGHENVVVSLLSNDTVNVDHRDHSGRTPLSYAVELNYINITRHLVESGADVNLDDMVKRTPLVWATIRGCNEAVNHLLSVDDVNVDHQDIDNRTSLSHAAEAGNMELMELLMKSGADGTHANENGHTCFWYLLKNRQSRSKFSGVRNPFHLLILAAYLSNPDFRDQNGRTSLSWAAEYGDADMVQALLQNGADPNLQDSEESTRNIHEFWKTPIIWALENEHEPVLELLKEKDTGSLHLILRESHIIGVKRALKLVQGFLDAKYNIEQVDAEGKRPLHIASNLSNATFARLLMSASPALDARDNSCKTPLQYAFMQRNEEVIKILLENGASTDFIESNCWFKLRSQPGLFVELTRQGTSHRYVFKPTAARNDFHWIPPTGEYRLCLHKKDDISWSKLYHEVSGGNNHMTGYICYGHLKGTRTPDNSLASHLSVSFPSRGEGNRKKVNHFWGIEWGVRNSSKGTGHGFVSTLPSCGVPDSGPEFINRFLEHLQEVWGRLCLETITDIEDIQNNQLERQGKSRIMIDRLARNARNRTELRRCLQQHIEGLKKAVDTDPIIEVDKKPQLMKSINNIQKSVMVKLDEVEVLVRELLQIELAWVSINEAGSIKRLTWITFIFLPLMFVSSLFGMNIDLLQNNPDWRWYLLFGGSSLLLTASIWIIFKYVPIETWLEERIFMQRRKHATVSDAV